MRDPNPKVVGGGAERLQAAGVAVTLGVEAERCTQLIYAFAHSVTAGRPWLTVKRAFDAQGNMIPQPGQKTFTSPRRAETGAPAAQACRCYPDRQRHDFGR